MINHEKYLKLIDEIKRMGKAVLAFSGGVDSSFLLYAGKQALGDQLKAVTIQAPYIPRWEIQEAQQLALDLGVAHEIIEVSIPEEIQNNPPERCYLCKKAVFGLITARAAEQGYPYVMDGTNFDDLGDYRPGLKALKELSVRSPLLECELTKQEIRNFSKELGIPTWNKPPYACLLTRIPHGSELKSEDFVKIEAAETYLMSIGFPAIRVRCHGDLARIEVPKEDRKKLFDEMQLNRISQELKRIGFRYVTLDLEGYRTGSLNDGLMSGGAG